MIDTSDKLCLLLLEINLASAIHCRQTSRLSWKRWLDFVSYHIWGYFVLLAKAKQQSSTSSCSFLTALGQGKATGKQFSWGEMKTWERSPVPCTCCRCPTEKPFFWRDLDEYVCALLYMADSKLANSHSITRQGRMFEQHFVCRTVSHL